MTREVLALVGMCVAGILCAVIFDMFRGVHYVLKKHDIAVIVTDILYWCIASFIIINSLWYLNSGLIRAYEFVGLVLGAVLYFLTVSKFVYKFFLTIAVKCVKIFKGIYKILLTLAGFLYKITMVPFVALYTKIRQRLTKKEKTVISSNDESEKQAV